MYVHSFDLPWNETAASSRGMLRYISVYTESGRSLENDSIIRGLYQLINPVRPTMFSALIVSFLEARKSQPIRFFSEFTLLNSHTKIVNWIVFFLAIHISNMKLHALCSENVAKCCRPGRYFLNCPL